MIKAYTIRVATPADIPQLPELYRVSGLTKSGPADRFKDRRLRNWQNPDVVLPLVACLTAQPSLVVATAELHSLGTGARDMAQLECVATAPDHRGRGLSKALLGRLFWYGQNVWEVGRIIWTSEALEEERGTARRFYMDVIGAQLIHGTNCNFSIQLPWVVPGKMRPYFVDPRV